MTSQTTDIFSAIVPAPFGAIGIRSTGDLLQELSYLPPQYKAKPASDKLSKKVAMQVAAYLKNPDYAFDLDLPDVGADLR
jgi:methylated-DNA-[protein]-cysteine S-methyltransferase